MEVFVFSAWKNVGMTIISILLGLNIQLSVYSSCVNLCYIFLSAFQIYGFFSTCAISMINLWTFRHRHHNYHHYQVDGDVNTLKLINCHYHRRLQAQREVVVDRVSCGCLMG